jgi:hypothetical protein
MGGRNSGQTGRGRVISFIGPSVNSIIGGGGGAINLETWNGTSSAGMTTSVNFYDNFIRAGVSYDNTVPIRSFYGGGSVGITNAVSFGGTYTGTGLIIGTHLSGGQALNGYVKKVTYYPRRLSNSLLQSLTQ